MENLIEKAIAKIDDKEKENDVEIWERVSELALEMLLEGGDEEFLKKARNILSDPEFKKTAKKIWDEQTLKEHIKDDPEEQERLWAKGLVLRIKEKLEN